MSRMLAAVGFLLFEVLLFALASLTHGGVILHGYEHARAAIAEAIIATVLGLGFVISLAKPRFARRTTMGVQLFAIVGVLVGLLMIAIGIGPRTTPDLVLHAVMLTTLLIGFLLALKNR